MKYKRIISFALAGVMLVSTIGNSLPTFAAVSSGLKLTYLDETYGDKTGNLIWGDTIKLKVSNKDNHSIKDTEKGLRVLYDENGMKEDTTNFEAKPESQLAREDIFSLTSKRGTATTLDGDKNKFYSVAANYNALMKEASTTQMNQQSTGQLGTFVASNGDGIPVSESSWATLTYLGGTQFEFKYDEKSTDKPCGVFSEWKNNQKPGVTDISNENPGKKQAFRIDFMTTQNHRISFDFQPNSYYEKEVTVNGELVKQRIDEMEKDTQFEILFNYGVTPQVGLQMHNQLGVLEQTAGKGKDFITPQDPTNDLAYITDSVNLKNSTLVYGHKVNLNWWYKESGKERVLIPEGFIKDTRTFYPKREQEDVKLDLIVRATYSDEGFFDVAGEGIDLDGAVPTEPNQKAAYERLKRTEFKVPITIKGTGTPTVMEQNSYITGQHKEEKYTDRKLPNTLSMNMFKGGVTGFTDPTTPYSVTLEIKQGGGNAFPSKLKFESSDPAVLTPILKNAKGETIQNFSFNSEVLNGTEPGSLMLTLNANQVGTTKLKFIYLIRGNNGTFVEDLTSTREMTVTVQDTSPDEIAQITKLLMTSNGEEIPFGFSPTTYDYPEFLLPHKVKSITLQPSVYASTQKDISMTVEQRDNNSRWQPILPRAWTPPDQKWEDTVGSGQKTGSILDKATSVIQFLDQTDSTAVDPINETNTLVDRQVRVTFKVRAENPNIVKTYTFLLRREAPSKDSSLKTLELFDEAGTNHMKSFVPKTKEYTVNVPYSTHWIRPVAVPNQEGATITYDPALVSNAKGVMGLVNAALGSHKEWVDLKEESTKVSITVLPENKNGADQSIYTLNIVHDRPGIDATLTGIAITDKLDVPITLKPVFNQEINEYELNIPYATEDIKILAKLGDKNATMTLAGANLKVPEKMSQTVATRYNQIPYLEGDNKPHVLTIQVTAEDGITSKAYKLNIFRTPPSADATLTALQLADDAGTAIQYDFYADAAEQVYSISVPYAVTKVTVAPVAANPNIKSIKVDGRAVASGAVSGFIKLDYPGVKKIEVVVTAEDGTTTKTYTLNVSRLAPGSDARLKALTVGGASPLVPVFVPKNTNYSATVAVDGKTVTVTATVNDPYATLKIDDKKAESGKASEPITLMDVNQSVKIEVTAQNGTTKMTYVVALTNENMIQKSNNADLRSLSVNYGEMKPQFKPSITLYEIAAGEETASVDIMPVPADRLATMKVFAGTKEIGDDRRNFSQAITDGENDFSVEVTSPDKKKIKTYSLAVYRNEEDKMGTLKPISPDEIDYEASDVIVVDITKYHRISADVFNELKKYPKKKIIFEGNDYSLQFNAKDLTKVIPSTTIYDFSMSFTSPEEQDIWDLIDSRKGNEHLRPVMIYFTHVGQLPAPALLNISLGRRYANRREYWNYYNAERERIDYYGYVETNSRGTFTVTLDHFSTYIATGEKIIGAENKSPGDKTAGQNLSQAGSGNKVNPGTGVSGGGS